MTYVISDLHGCYDLWRRMLLTIDLKESDELYVLGDVIDRGDEPVKLLFDMMERANVFPLLGNHEFGFWECIASMPLGATIDNFMTFLDEKGLMNLSIMIYDGGRVTLEQYFKLSKENRAIIQDYFGEFMLYYELTVNKKEFVLTHSGLMNFSPEKDISVYETEDYLFDRPDFGKKFYKDKTIIFGHSPTMIYPENPDPGKILKAKTYINIDCGCVFRDRGGRLGCLRLDDMKEFYV